MLNNKQINGKINILTYNVLTLYIMTLSRGIYSKLLVHHNIVSPPSVLERNLFKEQIVLVSWKTEI